MSPFVSIVIPCRNEAATIGAALEALFGQDYPPERMEILVVDGMSTDRTRQEVERRCRGRAVPEVRLFANPDRTTPAGLNIGIKAARGDVVFTFGGHSEYSPNYISTAVAAMQETGTDAVGSVAETMPGGHSGTARAIAAALSSRFGVGNSLMRVWRPTGSGNRPYETYGQYSARESDTASCPGYRRTVFDRIGRFNPELVRNQDIEFNLRLRRAGGRILVHPGIVTRYRARSRLAGLVGNGFANGYWVIRSLKFCRAPFAPRHLAPLALVAGLAATGLAAVLRPVALAGLLALAAAYGTAVVISAARAASSVERDASSVERQASSVFRHLLVVFPALHLSYGLGSLWALLTLWRPGRRAVPRPACRAEESCA